MARSWNARWWLTVSAATALTLAILGPAHAQYVGLTGTDNGPILMSNVVATNNVEQTNYGDFVSIDTNTGTALPNTFTMKATQGTNVTFTNLGAGAPGFTALIAGSAAFPTGGFRVGDQLIYNNFFFAPGTNAIQVDLPAGVRAAGARIMPNTAGASTFQVTATGSDGSVFVHTVPLVIPAYTVGVQDNSAPFLGVASTDPTINISRLVFNITAGASANDFFLGPVQFIIPEPASIALFGLGLAGAAGYAWKKRKLMA